MSPILSVIVCAHRPNKDRLARTLHGLSRQTLPPDNWEFLLIDNASPEPLGEDLAKKAHPQGRVLREEKLGLSHARLRGIRAARGAALVFVDDDNILAEDYIETAARFLDEHPEVHALGGRVLPEFEKEPEAWARPHVSSLALRDFGDATLISRCANGGEAAFPHYSPVGAGLVVRRSSALRYVEQLDRQGSEITGRKGSSLASGEECELLIHAVYRNQAEVAYVPGLSLLHLIPASRLRFRYLARLSFDGGVSWGRLLLKYNMQHPVPSWTLPFRIGRAFLRHKAWTRAGFIHWCNIAGFFLGRSR